MSIHSCTPIISADVTNEVREAFLLHTVRDLRIEVHVFLAESEKRYWRGNYRPVLSTVSGR